MTRTKAALQQSIGRMSAKAMFSRVEVARELLLERASEIIEQYLTTIKMAIAAGDFETATKAQQWLMEHFPKESGKALVDVSVDKTPQVEGPKGPQIQIGIQLGGIPASQRALPEPVIDVTPEKE